MLTRSLLSCLSLILFLMHASPSVKLTGGLLIQHENPQLYFYHIHHSLYRFSVHTRLIANVLSAAEEHICLHFSNSAHLTLHHTDYQLAITAIK